MNITLNHIVSLNAKQQKAFNKFKQAYNECRRNNIYFVNKYGSLHAYPADIVQDYGDTLIPPSGELLITLNGDMPGTQYINIPTEWCDDNHIMGLTKKGEKLYTQCQDETNID